MTVTVTERPMNDSCAEYFGPGSHPTCVACELVNAGVSHGG